MILNVSLSKSARFVLCYIDMEIQHDNHMFYLPAKTSVVPVLASILQWPYLTLKPRHGLLSAFQKWDSQPLKWRQVKVCQYALLYLPTFWHKCFGLLPFHAIGGWVLFVYHRILITQVAVANTQKESKSPAVKTRETPVFCHFVLAALNEHSTNAHPPSPSRCPKYDPPAMPGSPVAVNVKGIKNEPQTSSNILKYHISCKLQIKYI